MATRRNNDWLLYGIPLLIILAIVFWFPSFVFYIEGRTDLLAIKGPDVSNMWTMNEPVSASDFYYGMSGGLWFSLLLIVLTEWWSSKKKEDSKPYSPHFIDYNYE